jgi:PKD repeat protein
MKILMDKFRLTIIAISLLSSFSSFAQKQTIDLSNTRDGETVEYCTTHKKMHALMSNPEFSAQYAIDQAQMQQIEQDLAANPPQERVVYKVPVVFHVLHYGGVENISQEQILDALAILNRDFRLQNTDALNVHADFKASNAAATCIPSDVEIEFVLATKAPNGTCFSGITRTQNALSLDGADGGAQVDAIVSGNDVYNGQWPGNKYLNIFIAAEIGGAAGYTTNPSGWSASAMQNGIWILHNYVGSIETGSITGSRALTHEVGHWLNLSHTWGGNNNPGIACGSDQVNDTPETRGVTACALNENFCGPRANVENYMDYSYCSKMFSAGQVARMRAAMTATNTGRANLKSAANLTAVGADGNVYLCKANFTVPKQVICVGDTLQYSDESYNAASGWTWSFPGGTPATSTAQNPTVTYTTPGVYNVVLTATDGTTSDVETRTSYITVLPAGASIPFFESFETYNQTADITDFAIDNSVGTTSTWSLTNTAGATGSKSMKLGNFTQSGTNYDELISSPVDLSSITSPTNVTLSFKYAYRKKASTNSEILKVFLTADCGDSWQQRKTISGTSLSSLVETATWTPTSADWITVHMTNVTTQYWNQNFRYKFRFESTGGNNVYLDDINIYAGAPSSVNVLGIEEQIAVESLSVFPNPTDGELNVTFNMVTPKAMSFVVTDVLGKTIQTQNIQAAAGANAVVLSTEGIASGMYLLQIGDGSNKQVVQFMVK